MNSTTKFKGPTWCISKNQPKVPKLEILTKQDAYISIDFKRCKTTALVKCYPDSVIDSVIDSALKDSFVARGFSDWKIDPFNYEEPLQRYYKADWNGIVLKQTKATYIYLTTTEFTSDSGWILPDQHTKKIVAVEKIESDSGDITYDDTFYRLMIATSGNKNVYSHSYIKIQDVLARIGSLCSGFIFLLGIWIYPYSNLKMNETLVNRAFHVNVNDPEAPGPKSSTEYGDDISLHKRLEFSRAQMHDMTHMDHSKIEDQNKTSHRRLDNLDTSELRLDDQTVQNITQEKTDRILEMNAQIKGIELQKSRLRSLDTSNVVGSSTLLQEPPVYNFNLNSINDISPQKKPPIDTEANKPL